MKLVDIYAEASIPESAWDTLIGLSGAESDHYADAVGDYTITGVDAKGVDWGPSVTDYQIRTLRYPNNYGIADRVRDIEALRPYNPDGTINHDALVRAAKGAWIISENGTRWDKWSVHPTSTKNRNPQTPTGTMIETDATRRYWSHYGKRDAVLQFGHDEYRRWNLEGKIA